MGSQQLLLLVLGIIAVILMIFVGVNLFREYSVNSNRDQIITTLNTLTDMVQAYYKKPAEIGGGNGSYIGWTMPQEFANTEVGEFTANVRDKKVDLLGTGVEIGDDGVRNIIMV